MIYFMQPIGGGAVKIGFSDNVYRRQKELEGAYGLPLVVLATIDGSPEDEAEIHRRFAHLRFGRTEQFRPALDLLEFIGRPLLVGANPDAVEAIEPERLSVLNLKGSPEYRDWLVLISGQSLIPASTIVRDALAKWAKEKGYQSPPEI